jgi:2-polyprenyl-6-methoxyphenol hydroxylase-like FAD-dependent oxidoreductase
MTGGSFPKATFASPAGSGWRTPLLARGVLAAGDAAIAFHPLASRGIFCALTTGFGAAGAVIAAAGGHDGAIDGYVADVEHAAIEYRSGYRETYASERRFADLPFWARPLTAVSAG